MRFTRFSRGCFECLPPGESSSSSYLELMNFLFVCLFNCLCSCLERVVAWRWLKRSTPYQNLFVMYQTTHNKLVLVKWSEILVCILIKGSLYFKIKLAIDLNLVIGTSSVVVLKLRHCNPLLSLLIQITFFFFALHICLLKSWTITKSKYVPLR